MKETISGLVITLLVLFLRVVVALNEKHAVRSQELNKMLDDAMKEENNDKKVSKITAFFNSLNHG